MSSIIMEKQFYAITIQLASPLNISAGEKRNTDRDVIRYADGTLFVPGTSLAGAFREALNLEEKKDGLMGFSDGEDGKMSRIFISDLVLKDAKVTTRDGIRLNEEKQAENKFDLEIVETGATGIIFLECRMREQEDPEQFRRAVKLLVRKLQDGSIRLGSNKTRGFGRVTIQDVNLREFSKESHEGYLDFLPLRKDRSAYGKLMKGDTEVSWQEWANDTSDDSSYTKIRIPLRLQGGISIRRYSTQPKKADYEQLTCNGYPVIPGSSFNGAIQADIRGLLKSLGCNDVDDTMAWWFGYGSTNKPKNADTDARISAVVIGESILKESVSMPITRTQISRFDAAVIDGALYTELSCFGGHTVLEILVKKNAREYDALLGALCLAIRDISSGYLGIGGLTAVGRGIFEKNGPVECEENLEDKLAALYRLCMKDEVAE